MYHNPYHNQKYVFRQAVIIRKVTQNTNPRGLRPRGLCFHTLTRMYYLYYGCASTYALVFGPNNPEAGEIPFAFW